MAVGLGVEPSEPFQVLRISNPLHYHPAPRPFILEDVIQQRCRYRPSLRLVLLHWNLV